MNKMRRNSSSANTGKFVGESGRLLTLVPDTPTQSKAKRFVRCYCKSTFEFIREFELIETNRKYLCRIFCLPADDSILLSYQIKLPQKKYIEKLSDQTLDLERFDYFMEYNLS